MKNDFLHQLETQAQAQAKLNQTRILPTQLDVLTSVVGRYPWQSLLVLSILGAALWEMIGPWIW